MIEYDYESEMTQPVINHLQNEGYVCDTELCCGAGRQADIIAVLFDDEQCRKRMKTGPITPIGSIQNCSRMILQAPDWWPHFRGVTAVELKLTNWKTAIKQARAYSREVTESYICLPEGALQSEAKLDTIYQACENAGREVEIGLMALSKEMGVSYLKEPTLSEHVDALRAFWQAEKLWMKWRDRND